MVAPQVAPSLQVFIYCNVVYVPVLMIVLLLIEACNTSSRNCLNIHTLMLNCVGGIGLSALLHSSLNQICTSSLYCCKLMCKKHTGKAYLGSWLAKKVQHCDHQFKQICVCLGITNWALALTCSSCSGSPVLPLVSVILYMHDMLLILMV